MKNNRTIRKIIYKFLKVFILVILVGYLIPNNVSSPIALNSTSYWDSASFWQFPWGQSGVHKGIDIFCEKGTNVISPVSGFIFRKGYGTIAGNYVYIFGPKWRTYYFAHLDTVLVNSVTYITKGVIIGKVGNTGNALNKPPHLHYSIKTIFPYPWLFDSNVKDSWKRMFYLNPIEYLG